MASASTNALADGERCGTAGPRAPSQLVAVVLDVDDLHALGGAHVGDAAELVGARDLGGAVEAAGAVGDERLGPGAP